MSPENEQVLAEADAAEKHAGPHCLDSLFARRLLVKLAAHVRRLVARVEELEALADRVADDLVPVAGELMRRACGDSFIHEADCDCNTCHAFQATQKAITDLGAAVRAAELLARKEGSQ